MIRRIQWILFGSIPFLLPWFSLPWVPTHYGKTLLFFGLVGSLVLFVPFHLPKPTWHRDRWLWLLVGFTTVSHLLSSLFSLNSSESLFGVFPRYAGVLPQLAPFLLFVFLIAYRPPLERFSSILRWYLIPLGITLIFGVLQYFVSIPFFPLDFFEGRVDSLLGNPNNFALYLLLNFPILVYLWKTDRQTTAMRIILPFFFFLFTLALFLTGSRTAFFIFLIGMIAFGFIFRMKFLLLAVTIFFIGILSFFFQSSFLERYVFAPKTLVSLETRLTIWKDTLPVIASRPLFGFGHDQFSEAFQKFSRSELIKGEVIVDRAHNIILDTLVERGIFGLLTFLMLIVFLFHRGVEKISAHFNARSLFILCLLGVVVNYLLFLQMNFSDAVSDSYFWIALGLLKNARDSST